MNEWVDGWLQALSSASSSVSLICVPVPSPTSDLCRAGLQAWPGQDTGTTGVVRSAGLAPVEAGLKTPAGRDGCMHGVLWVVPASTHQLVGNPEKLVLSLDSVADVLPVRREHHHGLHVAPG